MFFACSLLRSNALRVFSECIVTFYESSQRVINSTANSEVKITWNKIRNTLEAEYVSLTTMKFVNPNMPDDEILQEFTKRRQAIVTAFQDLQQI